MTGLRYHLTSVDISEEALIKRRKAQGHQHEIMQGDLRTIDLPDSAYDVIYCSYVLEHIDGAESVLKRFSRWLKPGGLLILLIPDRNTLKGFVARMTPLWFHVLFYRYVNNDTNAGKPGYAPFRTYFDKIVSRDGIYRYCEQCGHGILAEYGDVFDMDRQLGFASPACRLLARTVQILSLNRITATHQDLMYVISKAR